ncbi:MAG TPA: hypothetical protein VGL02_19435 [Streptomyces sp.]
MKSMQAAIRFGVVSAVRSAAHQLADYWVQTDHQAVTKGKPGAEGGMAALAHVASYSLVSAAAVAGANRLFGLGLSVRGQVLGELISATSHYAADRREHGLLFPLARRLGKGDFLERGGAPLLDQSWHHAWNTAAAAATALDAD